MSQEKKRKVTVANVAGSAAVGCVIGVGLSWLTGGATLLMCASAAVASAVPALTEEIETAESGDCSYKISGGYGVRF